MNNFSILNLTNKLFIVQKVKLGLLKLKVQYYSLELQPVFEKLVHRPGLPKRPFDTTNRKKVVRLVNKTV